MTMEITEIDIDKISVKHQLRSDIGDLTSLENSIHNLGLLHPVVLGNDNVLISGGRRLQACRNAGLSKIPAIILDTDYNSMRALDILSDENLCRHRLSATDLEKHIQRKKVILEKGSAPEGGVFGWLKNIFQKR